MNQVFVIIKSVAVMIISRGLDGFREKVLGRFSSPLNPRESNLYDLHRVHRRVKVTDKHLLFHLTFLHDYVHDDDCDESHMV